MRGTGAIMGVGELGGPLLVGVVALVDRAVPVDPEGCSGIDGTGRPAPQRPGGASTTFDTASSRRA